MHRNAQKTMNKKNMLSVLVECIYKRRYSKKKIQECSLAIFDNLALIKCQLNLIILEKSQFNKHIIYMCIRLKYKYVYNLIHI